MSLCTSSFGRCVFAPHSTRAPVALSRSITSHVYLHLPCSDGTSKAQSSRSRTLTGFQQVNCKLRLSRESGFRGEHDDQGQNSKFGCTISVAADMYVKSV
eukprot:6209735-Pleurochrysis_carterae.AAC.1